MSNNQNFKIKKSLDIGASDGTAPIITNSTTLVTNLNADKLDGYDATHFQDALVSGTNIKTINGSSILGSGDLVVSSSGTSDDQVAMLIAFS